MVEGEATETFGSCWFSVTGFGTAWTGEVAAGGHGEGFLCLN